MSVRDAWNLAEGVIYLNHGSFGPAPISVIAARQAWFAELERQPMDFLVRKLEPLLDHAASRLAAFIGCDLEDLIFVPNATAGMNIVAENFALAAGDEVLLNDHEYGAVQRIWEHTCARHGAKLKIAPIATPLESSRTLLDALFAHVTAKTKLIVASHVTSQTATVFPIELICQRAQSLGIAVCVDGPHAIAMRSVRVQQLNCDFYTASCHKWLSAPLGTGFLYVAPHRRRGLRPTTTSWGKSLSGRPQSWKDEFHWPGTFDPSGYLAIPAAIEFWERYGLDEFRSRTHALAQSAREQLLAVTGGEALVPDSIDWYGSMVTVTMPRVGCSPSWPGQPHPLQVALWERHRIEVPIFERQGCPCIRVSCHLYNDTIDLERLVDALRSLTA